nr:hypothetical protein [uncultured Methanoregula sp.]
MKPASSYRDRNTGPVFSSGAGRKWGRTGIPDACSQGEFSCR